MLGFVIQNIPIIAGAGGMLYLTSIDYTTERPIAESFEKRKFEIELQEYTEYCWKVTAGVAATYIILSINGSV